jgi:hypothetical protein
MVIIRPFSVNKILSFNAKSCRNQHSRAEAGVKIDCKTKETIRTVFLHRISQRKEVGAGAASVVFPGAGTETGNMVGLFQNDAAPHQSLAKFGNIAV